MHQDLVEPEGLAVDLVLLGHLPEVELVKVVLEVNVVLEVLEVLAEAAVRLVTLEVVV